MLIRNSVMSSVSEISSSALLVPCQWPEGTVELSAAPCGLAGPAQALHKVTLSSGLSHVQLRPDGVSSGTTEAPYVVDTVTVQEVSLTSHPTALTSDGNVRPGSFVHRDGGLHKSMGLADGKPNISQQHPSFFPWSL